MKKNFLVLSFLLAAVCMNAFAAPGNDDEAQAKKMFQQQFAGAEHVKWEKAEGQYSRVSFTWSGHRAEAYFNQRGEFVGAIRGIFYAQMPLTVIRAVDKSCKDHVVLEVREITNEEGTSYLLLLERNQKRYKVKFSSAGEIQDEARVK